MTRRASRRALSAVVWVDVEIGADAGTEAGTGGALALPVCARDAVWATALSAVAGIRPRTGALAEACRLPARALALTAHAPDCRRTDVAALAAMSGVGLQVRAHRRCGRVALGEA